MSIIGIGNFSKYYFYIIVVFFCQFICDYLTVYNKDNDDELDTNKSIINYDYKLENHYIIQNLLNYLSSILCGILLYFFYSKTEKSSDGKLSLIEFKKVQTEYLGIKTESTSFDLFLIGIIYSAQLLLRTFLISLKFDAGLWTLEILIIIYFSNKILKVNFGRHQKVTVLIISVIGFILQIISFCLPRTKHNCKEGEDCKEIYIYDNNLFMLMYKKFRYAIWIPIIMIIYFIDFAMRDYGWVKMKYLMDTLAIPPFKILLFVGFSGTILSIISLIFTTSFPCLTLTNIEEICDKSCSYFYINQNKTVDFSRLICNLHRYDKRNKKLEMFYDNFSVFLSDYKERPLEIFTLLVYFTISGIINFCHIYMLKNIDSIIVLVNINFNYFLARLIDFLIKGAKPEYMTVSLFIILEILEIIAIFAYLIYMELIELKFWNLDYDLKINIRKRSKSEYEVPIIESSDENKDNKKEEDNKEEEDTKEVEDNKEEEDNNEEAKKNL